MKFAKSSYNGQFATSKLSLEALTGIPFIDLIGAGGSSDVMDLLYWNLTINRSSGMKEPRILIPRNGPLVKPKDRFPGQL